MSKESQAAALNLWNKSGAAMFHLGNRLFIEAFYQFEHDLRAQMAGDVKECKCARCFKVKQLVVRRDPDGYICAGCLEKECDGWHQLVVECERVLKLEDTAERPTRSNLVNVIRDVVNAINIGRFESLANIERERVAWKRLLNSVERRLGMSSTTSDPTDTSVLDCIDRVPQKKADPVWCAHIVWTNGVGGWMHWDGGEAVRAKADCCDKCGVQKPKVL